MYLVRSWCVSVSGIPYIWSPSSYSMIKSIVSARANSFLLLLDLPVCDKSSDIVQIVV